MPIRRALAAFLRSMSTTNNTPATAMNHGPSKPAPFEPLEDRIMLSADLAAGFAFGSNDTFDIDNEEEVIDVATDTAGNLYAVANIKGTVNVDPNGFTELATSGPADGDTAILKYSSDGTLLWAAKLGDATSDTGSSIAVDGSGNVYVTGSFTGTLDVDPGAGTNNLTSVGNEDAFVVALDSDGNHLWGFSLGAAGEDTTGGGIIVAGANVLLGAGFSGTLDLDHGAGTNNVGAANNAGTSFLAAYAAADGSFQSGFALGDGNTGATMLYSGTTDSSGNILLTGGFTGTVDFDPGVGTEDATSAGGVDIFVLSLDNAFAHAWDHQFGDTGDDFATSVATDGADNVFLAGGFAGTVDFDPGVGTSNLASAGVGDTDGFVISLDTNGDFVWGLEFNAADATGLLDELQIDVFDTNKLAIAGALEGTVQLDPVGGTAETSTDGLADQEGFVVELNDIETANPAFGGVSQFGGTGSSEVSEIVGLPTGGFLVGGNFSGTIDLDPGAATDEFTALGDGSTTDSFLARLSSADSGLVTITTTDPRATEEGTTTATFTVTRSGGTTGDLDVTITVGGTATDTDDFANIPTTVTIPDGQASATITVTPVDDGDTEGTESVLITLVEGDGYDLGANDTMASAAILDNEADNTLFNTALLAGTLNVFTLTDSITVTTDGAGNILDGIGIDIDGNEFDIFSGTYTLADDGSGEASFNISDEPGGPVTVDFEVTASNDVAVGRENTFAVDEPDFFGFIVDTGTSFNTADLAGEWTMVSFDTRGEFTVAANGTVTGQVFGDFGTAALTAGSTMDVTADGVVTITAVTAGGTRTLTGQLAQNSDVMMGNENGLTGADPASFFIAVKSGTDVTDDTINGNYANVGLYDLGTGTFSNGTVTGNTEFEGGMSSFTGTYDLTSTGRFTGSVVVTDEGQDPEPAIGFSGAINASGDLIISNATNIAEAVAEEGDAGLFAFVDAAPSTNVVGVTTTDTTAAEATPADATGAFTITRTGTEGALDVAYRITGTARNGVDYVELTGTATIPDGQQSVVITVTPEDDTLVEGDETVIITLLPNAAYDISMNDAAQLTIADNEPTVTIAATDDAAAEATPANATGEFTVTRVGNTTGDLVVAYRLTGTARNGVDYERQTGTVTIADGDDTATITITPTDDTLAEGDETVTATLINRAGYTVGDDDTADVTIADNEPVVTIVSDANPGDSVSEEGDTDGTFTVTRTGSTAEALEVAYRLTGTARNGVDYERQTGTVEIPIGQASATITIEAIDDDLVEGDETVTATLINRAGYAIGDDNEADISLTDNEPTVTIAATDDAADEDGGTGTFTVTRVGNTTGDLEIAYRLTGTARNGTDYVELTGTVTIADGDATATITVTPEDDALVEGSETVTATLLNRNTYAIGDDNAADITIADNEPTITIAATDDAADEDGGTGTFTVTRAGNTSGDLEVSYRLTGTARNGTDYAQLTGTVTILDGDATATITVTPENDALVENDETVTATLLNRPEYAIGDDNSADITIADNEPQLSIEAIDPTASEDGDNGAFRITRDGSTVGDIEVRIRVSGTARNGTDYGAIDRTITLSDGQPFVDVNVVPVNDNLVERDETAVVTILPSRAYTLGNDTSATVTIADNSPVINITANDDAADEDGDTGQFTVTRTGSTVGDVEVLIRVTGTARNGTDYTTIERTITIPDGDASVTIDVTPDDDALVEGDETVTVTVLRSNAYNLGDNTDATVTIADNEPVVTIAANDAAADEDGGTGQFTVTRTGDNTDAVVVNVRMTGTARNGTDYTTVNRTVTIEANQNTATIDITPVNDDRVEDAETVTATLVRGTGYSLGGTVSADVTIADNSPTITIASDTNPGDDTADEDGDTGTFRISRAGSTVGDVDVRIRVSGTARNGTDYTTTGDARIERTVTIPDGDAFVDIPVNVINDDRVEDDETVTVTVLRSNAYNLGATTDATVTIADNSPTITIASDTNPGDDTADEDGDTGTFRISRAGSTTGDVEVRIRVSGTARNGTDYTAIERTVTIPDGDAFVDIPVDVTNDSLVENDETVTITLLRSNAYNLGATTDATVTIADNEPVINITANDAAADEDGDAGSFRVIRTGSTVGDVEVLIRVSGTARNGTDYTAIERTVTIPDGDAFVDIPVNVINDSLVENDETVTVTLLRSNAYTLGDDTDATVTIADNEPVINIAANDAAADEDGDAGQFTVTRTGSTVGDVEVLIRVTGTARNGTDYTAIERTVTIPDGDATVTIDVDAINDSLVENDETVTVTLLRSNAYTLGDDTDASVTIADNEPVINIAANDDAADEDGDAGQFTVTRTGSTVGDVEVLIRVTGTARNGTDYTAIERTVTIPDGDATVTIDVDAINDSLVENDETVTVTLLRSNAYSLGDDTDATVTIADNEPVINIAANDNAAEEAGDAGQFTVTRTGSTVADVEVLIRVTGTARNGTDYTAIERTVTILDGDATATIDVAPIQDDLVEGDETVTVTVLRSNAYTLGDDTDATVTIADDEPTVTITANDAVADESGNNDGQFTVSRTGSTAGTLDVILLITGSARNGVDYTEIERTVTIPDGQASTTIDVAPIDDGNTERDETVRAILLNNAAYKRGDSFDATVTITADVLPSVTIAATDDAAEEEGTTTGQFTVTRTGDTTEPLEVTVAITGTATDTDDYTTIPTTVTIPADQATATITVTPVDDAVGETDETVIVTVQPAVAYTVGVDDNATVTIADNEPVITIAATDDTAEEEGTTTGEFTVTRTGDTAGDLVVQLNVTGTATATDDYTAIPATVTIPDGQASATITVTPADDIVTDVDETVIVTIADDTPYTVGVDDSATVTITDNEPVVSVLATDADAAEAGVDTGTFTISRTGDTTGALTVNYTITGTATDTDDYATLSGTVDIPDGQSSVTVAVTPVDDGDIEADETVILTIDPDAAYTVSVIDEGTVTIVSDD
ncbi:Calx-beta domain-containing protein [Mucisphaera calidilacus]|uniref:Calx-beta domain protein n=1 Tax=Mucisphaera calidilacus TaxID=2527982 RepID=A0A518C0T7_9BACT|nr:Calx-beta domain-containing protein [Mucisphaera calidilacus]QDU72836.1 Calx-beta domain protein [Mucisphaera calidilacus]